MPEISTIGINFTTEHYAAGGQSVTLAISSGEIAQAVVHPNPFQFRAIGFGGGQFVIVGDSGEIHVSSNGEHWQTLTTLTNSTEGFHFVDPEAALSPQRFYRLKPKPGL